MPQDLKKGQILVVKVPPFFDREYFYEISGAGGKMIRATLYHSPKVKKQWTLDEYDLLIEHGIVRLANDADLRRLAEQAQSKTGEDEDGPSDFQNGFSDDIGAEVSED